MHEIRVTYSISPPHGANADYLNIHSVPLCLHLCLIGPFCKGTKAEFCTTICMLRSHYCSDQFMVTGFFKVAPRVKFS